MTTILLGFPLVIFDYGRFNRKWLCGNFYEFASVSSFVPFFFVSRQIDPCPDALDFPLSNFDTRP